MYKLLAGTALTFGAGAALLGLSGKAYMDHFALEDDVERAQNTLDAQTNVHIRSVMAAFRTIVHDEEQLFGPGEFARGAQALESTAVLGSAANLYDLETELSENRDLNNKALIAGGLLLALGAGLGATWYKR